MDIHMKTMIRTLILLTLFTHTNMAFSTVQPEEMIKDIFAKAGSENLLNNSSKKVSVENFIDFGEMTKNILAQEFSKLPGQEVKWFEQTIKEIITRSVFPAAPKFLDNVKISYKKTQMDEAKAKVSSSVNKKGDIVDVDYFLKKEGDEWKIVDVAIDDESWVTTINEKVQKTIKEKGWKGLKELLSKRLNELKSSKKTT